MFSFIIFSTFVYTVYSQTTTCGEWVGDCSNYNDINNYSLNTELLNEVCTTRSEDCPYKCCYNEMGLSLGFMSTNLVGTCGPNAKCSNYGVGSTPCCDENKQSTICDVRYRNQYGEGNCYKFSNICENSIMVENVPVWKSYTRQLYDLNGEWLRDFNQEVLTYYKQEKDKTFVLYPYRGGGILAGWTFYDKDGYTWLIQGEGVEYLTNEDDWQFHGNGGNNICENEYGGCWSSTDLNNINIFCNDCNWRTDKLIPNGDCSSFYRCTNLGTWQTLDCSTGTAFNYEKQYCDWPYNFEC